MSAQSQRPNVELQSRDLELLIGLFESRLATLAQLAEIHFAGRKESAQNRVKRLKDAGFLKERARRFGEPSVLHLHKRGFEELQGRGLLERYQRFIWSTIEERAKVANSTLRHELNVMNVKAAFTREAREYEAVLIKQFCTWPMLYQFDARIDDRTSVLTKIKPDGFFTVEEPDRARSLFHFLEVDRGTEKLDTLVGKCIGYRHFYETGGMARRFGRSNPQDVPFRVILSVESEARRNNIAEALLMMQKPILRLVWLTTREAIEKDPFGAIYLTPAAYREAVAGTGHSPEHVTPADVARTRKQRDEVVRDRSNFLPLI